VSCDGRVVQPRASWLKEASGGRLTRLSRKAEHTSLIRLYESLYLPLPKAKQSNIKSSQRLVGYEYKVSQ
jgi:hypothetical protein